MSEEPKERERDDERDRREAGEGREKDEEREELFRRILVALDASPHSLAALQAAAELAARLDAELLGLYVEDIQLLRLSDFPLAREVNFYSSRPRVFDRQNVELQLRAQARSARRAMERLADRRHFRWSFRVVQGTVANEVLSASEETDLVIMGKVGWSTTRRLGSTTRIILEQGSRPAMILQKGEHMRLPVGVVYDGSALAQRALGIAANLMQETGSYLIAIILAGEVETARSFQADIARWLHKHSLKARFRWLIRPDLNGLKRVFQAEGCGILVLPAQTELFPAGELTGFLRETQCPVMLVR